MQLQMMDRIYESAKLTIGAAAGKTVCMARLGRGEEIAGIESRSGKLVLGIQRLFQPFTG